GALFFSVLGVPGGGAAWTASAAPAEGTTNPRVDDLWLYARCTRSTRFAGLFRLQRPGFTPRALGALFSGPARREVSVGVRTFERIPLGPTTRARGGVDDRSGLVRVRIPRRGARRSTGGCGSRTRSRTPCSDAQTAFLHGSGVPGMAGLRSW